MRNQINRHTNCDTANLGKTARANAQTLKAIRFLEEQGRWKRCPRRCSRQQPGGWNILIYRWRRSADALTRP